MRFYFAFKITALIELFTSIFILFIFTRYRTPELPLVTLYELKYDHLSIPIVDLIYNPREDLEKINNFAFTSSNDYCYELYKGSTFNYTFMSNNHTYQNLLRDSVKEGESCKEGYKQCGILDTNNTIMCIRTEEKCPINFLLQGKDDKIIEDYPQYTFEKTTLYGKYGKVLWHLFYTNQAIDKPILLKFLDLGMHYIDVYPSEKSFSQKNIGINPYTKDYYSNYSKVIGSYYLSYRPFIAVNEQCINSIGLSYTNKWQYEIKTGLFKIVDLALQVFLITGIIITLVSNVFMFSGFEKEFIFNQLIYYKLPIVINNCFIFANIIVQLYIFYSLHLGNQCANKGMNAINKEIETSLVETKEKFVIIIITITSSMVAKCLLWFIAYGCLGCFNESSVLLDIGPIVDIKESEDVITSETAGQMVDKPITEEDTE